MIRPALALLLAATLGASTQTKADKKAPAAAPAGKAAPAPAPAAKPAPGGAIVANKDSKTYHKADCKAAAKIKEAHKTSFGSSAEADKAGYKACKVCKP